MTHAAQPRLCTECEQELHRAVRKVKRRDMVAKYCEHHQTLGTARVERGVITGWYSQAPLTVDEARDILAQGLADAGAAA